MGAKIVGLGVCSIDQFVLVDEFCRPDDKVWVRGFVRQCGGVVANFCVGVARMGVRSGFMGSAGNDREGREILQNFRREGVDTGDFALKSDTRTPVNIIVVDSHGSRQILQDPYMERNVLRPREVRPEYVERADVFHTDAVNISTAKRCMQIVERAGTTVSFDLERHVAVYGMRTVRPLIQLTDILLPNRWGALELTNETNVARAARKLLRLGPQVVVVTLGERGALLVTEKEELRIPIYRVRNVADTTGAGDCFNSAFVSALHKGMTPREAADFAAAAAALSVTKVGAQTMPRWKEVEEFIRSNPPRGK